MNILWYSLRRASYVSLIVVVVSVAMYPIGLTKVEAQANGMLVPNDARPLGVDPNPDGFFDAKTVAPTPQFVVPGARSAAPSLPALTPLIHPALTVISVMNLSTATCQVTVSWVFGTSGTTPCTIGAIDIPAGRVMNFCSRKLSQTVTFGGGTMAEFPVGPVTCMDPTAIFPETGARVCADDLTSFEGTANIVIDETGDCGDYGINAQVVHFDPQNDGVNLAAISNMKVVRQAGGQMGD